MAFLGTQQKCKVCEKTVYLMDQLMADGVSYHKSCFKCNHCKGTLKSSKQRVVVFSLVLTLLVIWVLFGLVVIDGRILVNSKGCRWCYGEKLRW